ncbi:mechanosensitive ion channel family protein [Horticoccus luteus]|uniref:Mechanosensing system component YbdG n=1 Tax=Horticoccus luteus TaxID=2862869 RepID=A0A8F9XLY7_9BACT|nr:mechanosensitive ion channel domain-containing protein [Horticoccus luteus]QYM79706.1 mechanosensitive ion channel family protein [Horticoccus luteus]
MGYIHVDEAAAGAAAGCWLGRKKNPAGAGRGLHEDAEVQESGAMQSLITTLSDWLVARGFDPGDAGLVSTTVGLLVLVALAWAGNFIAKRVILAAVTRIVKRTTFQWDDVLLEAGVFARLSHVAPAMVINAYGDDVFGHSPAVLAGVNAAVNVYLTFILLSVLFAILDAIQIMAEKRRAAEKTPIKGFFQAIKLIGALLGLIFVLATVLNKSPVYLLSGLGALTAVLLLVFRDAILGFVAGIMLSVNDMVRVGDWIEMPKAGADGYVIDVSLTTVKVQNWDKTITTIPTYSLISESFKNWRGMFESGGRRIKRALYLDVQTIRFADEKLIERWRGIDLLKEYLGHKREEIMKSNVERGTDLTILGNGRRITNVGTFRAYCVAYLKAHPQIHQDMTFLVRQLAPTEHGLPLEIYVFTTDNRWAYHEAIQADIFDHLFSVVGEFDLRIFQAPSGWNFTTALARPKGDAPERGEDAEAMLRANR